MTDLREKLQGIRTFPSLVRFLREELDWPIDSTADFEDLTFEYTPDELGIDPANAAKIDEIKRLRPLASDQPWGIFFVKFEPKQLPVVALRRILNRVVVKKRATPSAAEQKHWATGDLLFISSYGDDDERRISFAHFSGDSTTSDLPTLRVLAWDDQDTGLHLDDVAKRLAAHLAWPSSGDESDDMTWRERWSGAFELRQGEVVTTSRVLSVRLAELARAIRVRIRGVLEIESKDGPVTALMDAFREALLHDLEPDDFADMYAQTIAYGLLSARVANPTGDGSAEPLPVTNPFLKELMATFLQTGTADDREDVRIDFDELGVSEVVQLLDAANMAAVVRDFGDRNPEEDPVIHFYERFLKEYDPEKRMQRGVFYTPRPVVAYIVRSVDELLRTDFGLQDGLAAITTWGEMTDRCKGLKVPEGVVPDAPFVQVLDPATGTGTFLVEAIDLIHHRMSEKWKATHGTSVDIEALWNDYVPKHLLPRLHGYELLMAPYAIAHLKIGLKLHETGYRFGSDERVQVFLTNALEPAHDLSGQLDFAVPALAHEARAVNTVKLNTRFTVVIGNPPYAGYSANAGPWIESLMERYKTTVREEERQIQRLSNDYVKFMRLAESAVSEAGAGLQAMITDSGYLNGILFRDMRAALRDTYPRAWLLNLHGVSMRGAQATAIDDENVFDITQGVAISVFEKGALRDCAQILGYADLIGNRTKKYLLLAQSDASNGAWTALQPQPSKWLFVPTSSDPVYDSWTIFTDLIGSGFPKKDRDKRYGTGIKTRHDQFAIGWDEADAVARVKQIADRTEPDAVLIRELHLCTTAHFSVRAARKRAEASDLAGYVRPLAYRPFDMRCMVYLREFVCEPKTETMRHMLSAENVAMAVLRRDRRENSAGFFVTRGLVAKDFVSNLDDALVWPLYLVSGEGELRPRVLGQRERVVNMAGAAVTRLLCRTGLAWRNNGHGDLHNDCGPEDVFAYIYAVLYSPEYRSRYREFLKGDFPRIPAPGSLAVFRSLSEIGGELIALHLLESDELDRLVTTYEGPKPPTVGRSGWTDGTVWLDVTQVGGRKLGRPGAGGFRGVPEPVWDFTVGGYQVCEKWLRDRRGRTLSEADVAHYHRIVAALSHTISRMQDLDTVIHGHGGWPTAFAVG